MAGLLQMYLRALFSRSSEALTHTLQHLVYRYSIIIFFEAVVL